jgi:hypothetical protein
VSWLPTEITEEKRQGKLSIGRLCAEATSTVLPKYASSVSARRLSTNLWRVVDKLRLTTSKRCSMAHFSPASRASPEPENPWPSTRTLWISQSGARRRTMLAHAVP